MIMIDINQKNKNKIKKNGFKLVINDNSNMII